MTQEGGASYRQILRATSIVGAATGGSIVIGLVRTKFITLLIGPAGIGLLGVFNAILLAGSVLAGLGIATSGVTELAAVSEDRKAANRVRAAIWSLTWLLAAGGGILLWVFRHPVAEFAAGGQEHAAAVGWLGIGVALSVVAASQSAVFQGFRQIENLARVKFYGALVAAVLGVAAVYFIPYFGIVVALIATPLGLVLVALLYHRRLPERSKAGGSLFSTVPEWRALTRLGFAVMLWTLIGSAAQLVVRAIIVRDMGLEAAGLFQASWMISANYQVLILAAMSSDYLPRLSLLASNREATNRLVNQQLHVAILLAAPMLAGMIATAPLVLTILYSSDFTGASQLLRWQLAGDALKISGWALGLVLMARKDMLWFLLGETCFALVYILSLPLLLPTIGLEAAGIGYFAGYALYNLLIGFACSRRHRIAVSGSNLRLLSITVSLLLILALLSTWSQRAALVVGILMATLLAVNSLRQLAAAGAMPARLQALTKRYLMG